MQVLSAIFHLQYYYYIRQERWKQVNTVIEYVDAKDRFSDNPASSILKNL